MHRRTFLTTLTATALPGIAFAYTGQPYSRAQWQSLQDQGKRVVLNWRADWSITCQIKQDLISTLQSQKPAYQSLIFVDIDWDVYGESQWAQRLKVKRRSTLVGMRGSEEIARLENEPYPHRVEQFLDSVMAG